MFDGGSPGFHPNNCPKTQRALSRRQCGPCKVDSERLLQWSRSDERIRLLRTSSETVPTSLKSVLHGDMWRLLNHNHIKTVWDSHNEMLFSLDIAFIHLIVQYCLGGIRVVHLKAVMTPRGPLLLNGDLPNHQSIISAQFSVVLPDDENAERTWTTYDFCSLKATIIKTTKSTWTKFLKCSWAHLPTSFIQSVVWKGGEPRPVIAFEELSLSLTPLHTYDHDSITCYVKRD